MLGFVAGGSPGALIGAIVGYLVIVVIGVGCGTVSSAEGCAPIFGVTAPFLLLIGYASGAAIGGFIGWRLGNDERPAS
jgi:ABC-type multidrug transport system permease subunit